MTPDCDTTIPLLWIIIGFTGQALFSTRFVVQWIASERAGRSLVPTAFWYFSILGALVLLSYAIHRQDPVFIVGQSFGFAVYARNLYFIHRERHRIEPST
jgi:lipid-A-disaccharide synthase-like uncharacterized protein